MHTFEILMQTQSSIWMYTQLGASSKNVQLQIELHVV